ncbi:thiamine-phosphate kinase [Thiofilum flexile]|uniref:thiamine-phosphate kinase n=1 Tax=Thiofilum flexile TaxID=125627 RepID=UPI000379424F|nr:thiamine-phosphate kinase [Thiofilum flexile]
MSEFDIIKRYFHWESNDSALVVGNGDDSALVQVPAGFELAVAVDTSNSGVHFPVATPADAVGYKSLAVNISDMAAMGATARWFTLSLSLPEVDEAWLQGFSTGLKTIADAHQLSLIGGDTTRGALSISIQILGLAPQGTRLLRSKAQVGDVVCVTGFLGDAAAGLALLQERLSLPEAAAHYCMERLNYPTARTAAVDFLIQHAHACIDISDGLVSEAWHLARQSQVTIELDATCLPYSEALKPLPLAQRQAFALAGGDDYELLFTLPSEKIYLLDQYFSAIHLPVTLIGLISEAKPAVRVHGAENFQTSGYDHFKY